jgi:hypothetical protein
MGGNGDACSTCAAPMFRSTRIGEHLGITEAATDPTQANAC